jgi:hypothetical protein
MLDVDKVEELLYSDEYASYIMANAGGDRIVCNGDMLIDLMEEGYLFEDFLESVGLTES